MGERTGQQAVDGLSNEATVTGSLAELGLLDLLQAIVDTKRSAALRIRSAEQFADLFFRDGDLIDAELGTLRGERAVYAALTWTEGRFEVDFRDIPRDNAMRTSTRRVLWEGRRRLEERTRRVAQLPALSSVFEVDCAKLLEKLAELPDEMNLVLKHFDGDKPLSEILSRCDLDELTTLSAFAKLISEGVIYARHPGHPSTAPDAETQPARERPPPVVSTLPPPRATVRNTLDYELDAPARHAAAVSAVDYTSPSPLPERPLGERTLRGMRAPRVANDLPGVTGEPAQVLGSAPQAGVAPPDAGEREIDTGANSRPTVRAAPPEAEAELHPSPVAPEPVRRRRRRRRRSALSDAQPPPRRLRSLASSERPPAPATSSRPSAAVAAPGPAGADQAHSLPAASSPVRRSVAMPVAAPITTERSRAVQTLIALTLVSLLVSAMIWLAKLADQ